MSLYRKARARDDFAGDAGAPPSVEQIRRGGFSTPFDAPMIPPFPLVFRDARVLTAIWRTTPAAVARVVPPPLAATGDIALAHIYDMHDPEWIGPYQECNVMIGAQTPGGGRKGGFSPWLFLSSDIGVAHGREIHGQPKKFAQPKIECRGDLIVGSVERNGIEIITATIPYKQQKADLGEIKKLLPFDCNLNLKAVDHIDGRPAIRQITARRLESVVVRECWRGPGTVELRPNAQAPVFRLPVVEMLCNYYWRADFTLVAGEIVHDYLTDENK